MIDGTVAGRALDDARRRLERGAEAVRAYLASPQGRRLRRRVARVVIVSAPLVTRLRVLRATPAGRLIGAVGGAALLVRLAEALRDWDPESD